MDGNKDEALRCVGIAREAIASGNKQRALKFIGIAQRLNYNLSVDNLLAACESLESSNPSSSNGESGTDYSEDIRDRAKSVESMNGVSIFLEEHVQLIRKIQRNKDYYEILGLQKCCSVEEIRKAYRKLSLKVHPDKNKVPGAEEAFKKVCMAFKCLSNNDLRRRYDETGFVEGYDFDSQQYNNVRRRRRGTGHSLFEEDFDPDDIFRSFFGQDLYRANHVYGARRGAGGQQQENNAGGTGPNLMVLLQLLPFLLIILLAYLPFSEPDYSLQRNYTYQFPRTTEQHGVEFFVKSPGFDQSYPVGSPSRVNIESSVIKDYKNLLGRYCQIELQRRSWNRKLPTPHCEKLQSLGLA